MFPQALLRQKRRNRFCIYVTGAQTFLKSILENVQKVFILPIVSSQQVDQVFQGFHLIEFEGGFHSGIPGLGVHLWVMRQFHKSLYMFTYLNIHIYTYIYVYLYIHIHIYVYSYPTSVSRSRAPQFGSLQLGSPGWVLPKVGLPEPGPPGSSIWILGR